MWPGTHDIHERGGRLEAKPRLFPAQAMLWRPDAVPRDARPALHRERQPSGLLPFINLIHTDFATPSYFSLTYTHRDLLYWVPQPQCSYTWNYSSLIHAALAFSFYLLHFSLWLFLPRYRVQESTKWEISQDLQWMTPGYSRCMRWASLAVRLKGFWPRHSQAHVQTMRLPRPLFPASCITKFARMAQKTSCNEKLSTSLFSTGITLNRFFHSQDPPRTVGGRQRPPAVMEIVKLE